MVRALEGYVVTLGGFGRFWGGFGSRFACIRYGLGSILSVFRATFGVVLR